MPPFLPLFLDLSGGELLVILLAVFILFGPKKLPEIARQIGKGINELKKATDDIKTEITKETDNIKSAMESAIAEPDEKTGRVNREYRETIHDPADDETTKPDPESLKNTDQETPPESSDTGKKPSESNN